MACTALDPNPNYPAYTTLNAKKPLTFDHAHYLVRWAIDNPAVADLFAEDAKMLTQDKQNLTGRPAILKQLEKGAALARLMQTVLPFGLPVLCLV